MGDLLFVQLASYLERGPLMWKMPLHLHVNQKSDYDYDSVRCLDCNAEVSAKEKSALSRDETVLFLFSVNRM